MRVMRFFLWASVLGWGIGLGAKLFDLIVVAGAWSAAPPSSFALLPYGPRFPINPGDFFQPLSAVMALGILGALISGWRAPQCVCGYGSASSFFHQLGDYTYRVLADDPGAVRQCQRQDQSHRR